jgi:hypothetical protein
MADKGRDPSIIALEAVYAALKDMDAAGRKKVLSSAFALLGVEGAPALGPSPQHSPVSMPLAVTSARPVSLVELINEKQPDTNAERIALFAYYREKSEGLSRFGRDDLKSYFAKAKLSPAANFDRDFVDAVRKGWIHEDAADSYLTTKGIEAVESSFEVDVRIKKSRKSSTATRKKARRTGRNKKHR